MPASIVYKYHARAFAGIRIMTKLHGSWYSWINFQFLRSELGIDI